MNYLTRPVFFFQIDWSGAVERSLTFDLRQTTLGFGADYFVPTMEFTATGWDFSLYHKCGADILAFESFADALTGRLQGFWLPCPLRAAVFTAAISTTQFKIVAESLSDTWNARPDTHLFFTFADGSQAAGQIQGVVDNGDGTETVTMTAALPQAPAAGTVLQRLHYVRFASDTEEIDYDEESAGAMKLTVIELPLEYTDAETGLQPIYLYNFRMKAPANTSWHYTSFAAPVVNKGNVYAAWPMTHGAIKQTVDGNSNQVEVTAKPDDTHPLSLYAGIPPGCVLWVDIYRCYLGASDTTKTIFSGFVTEVQDDGDKYTAKCDTRIAWLKTKLPRFYIGTQCNWTLYDQNTCKVGRALFETTVTITAIEAGELPVIRCTFNFGFQLANWQTVNWFQGGTFEIGIGLNYELRSIVASEWDGTDGVLRLTLNAPLTRNGVGAQPQIAAGCDHTPDGVNGCTAKFNNFKNFGGFVAVPDQNLSLKGLNTTAAQGNKKI